MKIAYIINDLSVGGAEKMLFRLAEKHDRQKLDVEIVSLTSGGPIAGDVKRAGIPLLELNFRKKTEAISSFIKLVQHLKRTKPDIVSTWMYHSDLLGGIAAKLAGIKNVVWGVRHTSLRRAENKITTIAVAYVCAALSRVIPSIIIVCSRSLIESHTRAGYDAKRMILIPNGIDLNHFKADIHAKTKLQKIIGANASDEIIGTVGRFHAIKNPVGFIQAASEIARVRPTARFVMIGRGYEEGNPELIDAIKRCKLMGKIHLLGLRADIEQLIPGFDVLVSSSHSEAFPNVVCEAMACSVPCAATDAGDSAEIIGDAGYVVEKGDMQSMANVVIEHLEKTIEERRNLGRLARARVEDKYDLELIKQMYEDVFQSLNKRV